MSGLSDVGYPSKGYWVFDINIPKEDSDLVRELASYTRNLLSEIVGEKHLEEDRRRVLSHTYVAENSEEILNHFAEAERKDDGLCIVLAFNAKLTEREYDQMGVLNIKFLRFPKRTWKRLKRIFSKKDLLSLLQKLIWCLARNLCQMLLSLLQGNTPIPFGFC